MNRCNVEQDDTRPMLIRARDMRRARKAFISCYQPSSTWLGSISVMEKQIPCLITIDAT